MKNTILPPDGSAIELYNKGVDAEIEKDKAAEALKVNTLRGGSSGCHLGRGEVVGDLYRAVARYMGYSLPIPRKTRDIFALGYSNEEIWEGKFNAGGIIYKADSDYPLSYDINGNPVTGRPDCVVGEMVPIKDEHADAVFTPEFGIEHKVISSCAVAAKMQLTGKPKDDNFIQACHYSYKFNLPWTLVYSFYGIGAPPFYSDAKALKELTGEGVVRPFKKEFKIGCDEGKFYWADTDTGVRTDTVVTAQGIQEFYELMLDIMESKDLTTVKKSMTDIYGKPMFFDVNAYDEMRLTTNMDGTWDDWIEDLEWVNRNSFIINTRKVNRKPTWNVINTETGTTDTFNSHKGAYRFMKEQGE